MITTVQKTVLKNKKAFLHEKYHPSSDRPSPIVLFYQLLCMHKIILNSEKEGPEGALQWTTQQDLVQ